MPPEITIEGLTWNSQVWSLGVLGYFVLSGELPYTGPKDKRVVEGPSFDSKLWEPVSQELKSLLKAMLSVSPAERPKLEQLKTLFMA